MITSEFGTVLYLGERRHVNTHVIMRCIIIFVLIQTTVHPFFSLQNGYLMSLLWPSSLGPDRLIVLVAVDLHVSCCIAFLAPKIRFLQQEINHTILIAFSDSRDDGHRRRAARGKERL